VPHFRRIRQHLEEAFIEIRDINIIPTVTEGILGNDVASGDIEKKLKI
jgi:hypothetical protein